MWDKKERNTFSGNLNKTLPYLFANVALDTSVIPRSQITITWEVIETMGGSDVKWEREKSKNKRKRKNAEIERQYGIKFPEDETNVKIDRISKALEINLSEKWYDLHNS